MTVTLDIPLEHEQRVLQRASAHGKEVGAYLLELIQTDLANPVSISEAAEPFARAVEASGISVEEFDNLVVQAIGEVRAARKGNWGIP